MTRRLGFYEEEEARRKTLPPPCSNCGSYGWVEHTHVTCNLNYWSRKGKFPLRSIVMGNANIRKTNESGFLFGIEADAQYQVMFFDPGFYYCEHMYHVVRLDGDGACIIAFESLLGKVKVAA